MGNPALSRRSFDHWGSPAHTWLAIQATVTTIIITWFAAGETTYAPQTYTVLATSSILPVIRLATTGHQVRWGWYLPFLLVAGFLGISLMNPSHIWDPDLSKWRLNPDWIRFLPTTMDPPSTLGQSAPLLATLVLGGSVAAAHIPPQHVNRAWLALVINAMILSLVGATVKFSGTSLFMGFKETRLSYFFATFTYRNHWSAFAILMTAVAAGYAFSYWKEAKSDSRKIEKARLFATITLLVAFTPVLAGSRSGTILMGLLLTLIGMVAVFQLRRKPGPSRSRLMILGNLGIVVAVFTTVVALSWPHLSQRFSGAGNGQALWVEATKNLRIQFTKDTLSMAAQRPVYGWGLGSYVHVFPKFQGDYLRDETGKITTTVDKAHNDWAQTVAEIGIVGLVLLVVPVCWGFVIAWSEGSFQVKFALIGIMFLAVYAFIDFPLRNLGVVAHSVLFLTTASRLPKAA
ncbi:MAG: hypothetical protein SynsKO_13060 [Synoicihabitans sp.]